MKFNIKITIEIDEEERILPIVAEMHEEAVAELFQDIIYDIDGAVIRNIEVKKHELLFTNRLPKFYTQITLR